MVLLAAASVFWSLQAGKIAQVISVVCWGHLALVAARNIPLFLMVATPVVAGMLESVMGRMRLVPGVLEAHLRVGMLERILDDGVADVAEIFHSLGMKLDVWTLDATAPDWRERLGRILAAGVDIVSTNTARELAAAGRPLTQPPSARGATP